MDDIPAEMVEWTWHPAEAQAPLSCPRPGERSWLSKTAEQDKTLRRKSADRSSVSFERAEPDVVGCLQAGAASGRRKWLDGLPHLCDEPEEVGHKLNKLPLRFYWLGAAKWLASGGVERRDLEWKTRHLLTKTWPDMANRHFGKI